MSRKRRNSTSGSRQSPSFNSESLVSAHRSPSSYPRPIPLRVDGNLEEISTISMNYQLTVRSKVELHRYQVSMLLEVLLWEIVNFGCNFSEWLVLDFLYSYLLGSKQSPLEIRNKDERRVAFVAQIILRILEGNWLNLSDRENLSLILSSEKELLDLLPSQREIQSRIEYWVPTKFLEIRAVRLDVRFERENNSSRYSSYCKGYGEGNSMGRRQRTRPSAELDGENEKSEVVIPLTDLPVYLYLNQLDVRYKMRKLGKR